MASRRGNGGMVWRTGAWSGLVLLAALDGALLMRPAATPGNDRAEVRATRRATAHPSPRPRERTARQEGVRPISDLVVPR